MIAINMRIYLLDWHRGVACCQAPAEVLQQLLKFYETLWELMQAQGSHLASDDKKHIISYHTISYHTISYHIISFHIIWYIYIYICMYVCMYVCIYVCMLVYIYIYACGIFVIKHWHAHTLFYFFVCMYFYISLSLYMYRRKHTHEHTLTHKPAVWYSLCKTSSYIMKDQLKVSDFSGKINVGPQHKLAVWIPAFLNHV